MEIDGARILVAGATGTLGGKLARALREAGASVALAGRDEAALAALATELGGLPATSLDLTEPGSAGSAVAEAAKALGGLDGLVVATGAVAFGEFGDDVARELFAVNALGPIALISTALDHIDGPGGIVTLSAIVADMPTAGMAPYSASKAALSAYVAATRREVRRRKITMLDVRPGHLDTPFAERALAGEPPKLPEPQSSDDLVAEILEALRADQREITAAG